MYTPVRPVGKTGAEVLCTQADQKTCSGGSFCGALRLLLYTLHNVRPQQSMSLVLCFIIITSLM